MGKITKKTVLFMDKPFKNIAIGDPSYFETMEELEMKESLSPFEKNHLKNLRNLTLDYKPRCCKVGAVLINQVEDTFMYDGREYPDISTNIEVYLAKDKAQLDVYLNGRWYGESTVKKTHELGCDTARFEINVDDRFLSISTGADGYYGYAQVMKQYYGFRLSLSMDTDMLSFDEAVRDMAYVFNAKEAV